MASARRFQFARGSSGRELSALHEPLREISLMTVPEVAGVLRTSSQAVYAMIEHGPLPGVLRINRRVLFNGGVLLDWLGQKSRAIAEGVNRR